MITSLINVFILGKFLRSSVVECNENKQTTKEKEEIQTVQNISFISWS